MATFTSLPVELQHHCIQYFDIDTLKQFRLASRSSSALGTAHLFHTAVLAFSDESAARFTSLLSSPHLKAQVKKVVVDGTMGHQDECDASGRFYEHDEDEYPITPWAAAIARISEFVNLREAELKLFDECYEWEWYGECEQDPFYRQVYQNRFFSALSSSKIESLTLKNIQDAVFTDTGSEETINAVRSQLKRLHLMVVTEACTAAPENKVEKEELHQCFNDMLTSHWLQPLHAQLTHLTVYCDTYWGVFPLTDLRGLHFPALVSLALGNWTIAHDWQIDWITSHGDSLQELVLDDVCIVYCLWMPEEMIEDNWPEMTPDPNHWTLKQIPTRWHEVFPIFQQRLSKLRRFGMGHGDWHTYMFEYRYELPARIESTRYITYYHGIGPSQWTKTLYKSSHKWGVEHKGEVEVEELAWDQDAKDMQALDDLLRAIGTPQERIEEMKDLTWNSCENSWQVY